MHCKLLVTLLSISTLAVSQVQHPRRNSKVHTHSKRPKAKHDPVTGVPLPATSILSLPPVTATTTSSSSSSSATSSAAQGMNAPFPESGEAVLSVRDPAKRKKASDAPIGPYLSMAHQAIAAMQTMYNTPRPGQWSGGWWNSANAYTLLADLRVHDHSSFLGKITNGKNGVFVHTVVTQDKTAIGGLKYDSLIKAYDVTGNSSFLQIARATWQTVQDHALNAPCGGLYNAGPGIPGRAQSTIATLLYIQVTALLAVRYPGDASYFIGLSQGQWQWVWNNIWQYNYIRGDGQKQVPGSNQCTNNGAILSYIEGTAINALVALNAATGNGTYLQLANTIATTSLYDRGLNQNGILHDTCDNESGAFGCNPDEAQFKGIFMRGLRTLYDVMPSAVNGQIPAFLRGNANAIWANARGPNNLLGQRWSGPYNDPGTDEDLQLAQHSSATMALVAACFL